ncbi:hypothetical protein SprV_0200730300 [Sparganum proliferum]
MLSDMLMDAYRDERPGIRIAYRTGSHLNSRRMQALTCLPTITVHDLPFSDDCALNTTTEVYMQRSVEPFAAGCANSRLIISMDIQSSSHSCQQHRTEDCEQLPLRRQHIRCIKIDDEVVHWIFKASQAFSRLQNSV